MAEGSDDPLSILNDSLPLQIIVGIVVGFILILIIAFIKFLIYRSKRNRKATPYLIKGNMEATQSKTIHQNPNNSNSIPILRSRNEKGGIEFTYTVWLYVKEWVNYRTGKWKHVFHKGSRYSSPNNNHHHSASGTASSGKDYAMIASPGLWFHPDTNSLRVYMNTYKNMNEYIDIANIPANKWYHLSIVVKETSLNVYINGFLKQKHNLSSLPRQNFGDAYVGLNGGFNGYIADLRYHDYALPAAQILKSVGQPPSTLSCTDSSGNSPPYLDTNWWQNKYN